MKYCYVPIVPLSLAVSVHVCVFVCVCVLPVCVNVYFQVAKMLKKITDHLQLNGASPVFLLDLDLHFQGQSFAFY